MIRPKEREAIITSLKSGVVPRVGLQHIQVGRVEELKSFVKDVDTISEGGTSFRLVIGEYGSGKTFFLSLVRSVALQKGLVTMNADLSPTKRLHGKDGQARCLLSALIESISTRTKQDGKALPNILEKFISTARNEAEHVGGDVTTVIYERLRDLNDYPGGYAFSQVVNKYWMGYESGDDMMKENALRWLKAEYATKTDSMRDLGVREILDGASFFNTLKLYSVLVKKAGYSGLLVCMDEMVNLFKISNAVSRKANYEEILNILNNTLQGCLSHIGFILSGTPEFLTDGNRGLYSYEALRSRLAENTFSKTLGLIDYNSTVLRLANLTKEELYLLLKNLRNVFAGGDLNKYLVPDDALLAYLNYCANKIGDSYFRTPRNTIKGFLDLLSILAQYPNLKWSDMIEHIDIKQDIEPTEVGMLISRRAKEQTNSDDDVFASFKL